MTNENRKVIRDFLVKRKNYNQSFLDKKELSELFNNYFSIFPFTLIDKNSEGFDMGCGSGRWAEFI